MHVSGVWLFVTPWTVAHQAPLSMGLAQQEYLRGLPRPPPGGLPGPETDLQWQVDSLSPGPNLPFENALPKPLQELEAFQHMSHLMDFHGLVINLLLHTLMLQFVWPHSASGT